MILEIIETEYKSKENDSKIIMKQRLITMIQNIKQNVYEMIFQDQDEMKIKMRIIKVINIIQVHLKQLWNE